MTLLLPDSGIEIALRNHQSVGGPIQRLQAPRDMLIGFTFLYGGLHILVFMKTASRHRPSRIVNHRPVFKIRQEQAAFEIAVRHTPDHETVYILRGQTTGLQIGIVILREGFMIDMMDGLQNNLLLSPSPVFTDSSKK